MALTKLTTDLSIIQGLPNQPSTENGYTAESIKELFDTAPNNIKTFLNNTLIPEAEAQFETKDSITTNRKLSVTGDFSGTWNGVQMTAAEPGLSSAFNAHLLENVNVKHYGAVGDGVTDDTQAFLNAISYLATKGGGILFVPPGNYVITSTLNVQVPIMIMGHGNGQATTNTNGTSSRVSTITWNGVVGGTMIYFDSDSPGQYLFGGGVKGLMISGNDLANIGIRCSSVGYMKFDIEGRNCITDCLVIDDAENLLSQFNVIERIHYVYGTTTTTENSNALRLEGSGIGVTQNHIFSITALLSNGNAVKIVNCDNNVFEKVHATTTGTGHAVYLGAAAANNFFAYLVGDVKAEATSAGNRILHYNSEGGTISVDAGGQLHYVALDYVQSGVFETNKFLMSDHLRIPIGSLQIIDGSATNGISSLQWAIINLPDSANARIGTNAPPPYNWSDGIIQKVRIWFNTDTANTSANWVAQIKLSIKPNGGTSVPELDQQFILSAPDGTNYLTYVDCDVNSVYVQGDFILLSITRLPTNASDTVVGNIQVHAIELIYQNNGPNSAGSGTYSVTSIGS